MMQPYPSRGMKRCGRRPKGPASTRSEAQADARRDALAMVVAAGLRLDGREQLDPVVEAIADPRRDGADQRRALRPEGAEHQRRTGIAAERLGLAALQLRAQAETDIGAEGGVRRVGVSAESLTIKTQPPSCRAAVAQSQ